MACNVLNQWTVTVVSLSDWFSFFCKTCCAAIVFRLAAEFVLGNVNSLIILKGILLERTETVN